WKCRPSLPSGAQVWLWLALANSRPQHEHVHIVRRLVTTDTSCQRARGTHHAQTWFAPGRHASLTVYREVGGLDMSAVLAALAVALKRLLGADAVIDDPVALGTYDCDGLTAYRARPGLVVLPETTTQVAAVVRACS